MKSRIAAAAALIIVGMSGAAIAQTFPGPGQVKFADGIGSDGAAWSAGVGITPTAPGSRFEFITGGNPGTALCDPIGSVQECSYITIDLTAIESQKIDQSTGQLIWTRAHCAATGADVVVSDGVALGYPAPTWPKAFFTWGGDPALGVGVEGGEAYDIFTGSATLKIEVNYPYLNPYSAYGFYLVCEMPAG